MLQEKTLNGNTFYVETFKKCETRDFNVAKRVTKHFLCNYMSPNGTWGIMWPDHFKQSDVLWLDSFIFDMLSHAFQWSTAASWLAELMNRRQIVWGGHKNLHGRVKGLMILKLQEKRDGTLCHPSSQAPAAAAKWPCHLTCSAEGSRRRPLLTLLSPSHWNQPWNFSSSLQSAFPFFWHFHLLLNS